MTPTMQAEIAREVVVCRAAFEANPNAAACWTQWHNNVVTPMTSTELPKQRIEYILANKPEDEQALRLRNFRPVMGRLLAALDKAWVALTEAGAACVKARDACNKAEAHYDKALSKVGYDRAWVALARVRAVFAKATVHYDKAEAHYDKAIDLHATELQAQHDREWPNNTWNGKTIFKAGA